jgi:hypothetical protein
MATGDLESASRYGLELRRATADSPMALYHASFPTILSGDLEGAEVALQGVVSALPDLYMQSFPGAQALLAWVQARLGRAGNRDRIEELRRLRVGQLAEFPNSSMVRSDLTLAASVLGEPEEQLDWFLETVQRDKTGALYLLRELPWLDRIRERPEFQAWLRESEERMAARRRELEAVGEWTPEAVLRGVDRSPNPTGWAR